MRVTTWYSKATGEVLVAMDPGTAAQVRQRLDVIVLAEYHPALAQLRDGLRDALHEAATPVPQEVPR